MQIFSSSIRNPLETTERYRRNSRFITIALMLAAFVATAVFAYSGYTSGQPLLYIPSGLWFTTMIVYTLPLSMISKGRVNLAMMIAITMFVVNALVILFLVQGLGPIIAAAAVLIILSITGLAMTSNYSLAGVLTALFFGTAVVVLDFYLGINRIQVPQLTVITPIILTGITIALLLILFREFRNFSFQVKITFGILLSGGVIVATLIVFGFNYATAILDSLTERFEGSVTDQIEAQIFDTIQAEADRANAVFAEAVSDLSVIASYRGELETQQDNLIGSSYWNATEKVFQLPGGQYGNSSTDLASVFIPRVYSLTEEMVEDINTSIYLDFLAVSYLESHPEVTSVYYISSLGYTVFYPNINLAQNVPPDFNPTPQPFYSIAAPDQNPERLPRWTKPYQDPAGAGMIVTLSVPVYSRTGTFKGVIGADIKLSTVADGIASVDISPSSLAFLVDKNGFILAMPEEGYQLFGLEPEVLAVNESPRQSILSTDSEIMLFAAQRIVISQTNLLTLPINGVETYLAIASLDTTEYKLVILAPTNELNQEIVASRTEVEEEVNNFFRSSNVVLAVLFVGSFIISLLVGQIITRPVKRLTNTVEEIASGNLAARVQISSEDETGVLGRAFNTMADQLNETLHGLEEKIAERTAELEKINASNAYRAAQFESIARISNIISSTQTLDRLLPQISETISEQLGFYHVGIFLLDIHKDYAVLAAANSEGGRRMLERNHRLRVGETGIVGYVTKTGQPRIALDVGQDSTFFNNPDLPETHSEISLPLKVGTEIIGALDVQSTEINAFSQEDVNILSALADQVSIAIQNARYLQQSREALEQAEMAAAQLSQQQWSQFLSRQGIRGYHFDGINARKMDSTDLKHPHSIAIPLILRGTQIGTLKLSTSDPSRKWDEDEIALAQATAERTALAIENARLLQEAQKRASKEQTIGQISAKISTLVNLDNILQTTLQELGSTLSGTDVAIQFLSGKSEQ